MIQNGTLVFGYLQQALKVCDRTPDIPGRAQRCCSGRKQLGVWFDVEKRLVVIL